MKLPSKSPADADDRRLGYVCDCCGCVDGNIANGTDLCGDCYSIRFRKATRSRLRLRPGALGRLLPAVRR